MRMCERQSYLCKLQRDGNIIFLHSNPDIWSRSQVPVADTPSPGRSSTSDFSERTFLSAPKKSLTESHVTKLPPFGSQEIPAHHVRRHQLSLDDI